MTQLDPLSSTRDLAPLADPGVEPADPSPGPSSKKKAARSRRGRRRSVVKILFVSANAVPGKQLAIDAEYRVIEQSLRLARYRGGFRLIPKLAAREGDLQQALLEHQPDIVHFACHGSVEAELLLFGSDGARTAVPAPALTALFRVLHDHLSLVVFNACWSRDLAEAIRASAGLCIGMREPIDDPDAIKFAGSLYGALGYGRTVREAFALGVAAIKRGNAARPDIPQLFEDVDGDAGRLVLARPRPSWALAGGLLAAGCLAVAGWWSFARATAHESVPADRLAQPAQIAGMVHIAAATLSLETPARRPPEDLPAACLAQGATEACSPAPRGLASTLRVEPFELDREEVSNRDFAAWLSAHSDTWTISPYGVVTTLQASPLPLVRIVPECGGGLIATAQHHVRAGADKGAWPVTCVTWHGAQAYCRWQGKRLPLASEWELAARGREGRLFPWGDDPPKQDVVAFDLGDGATRHPRAVGTSPQDVTPQGVHDLGGNVAEWVEDGRGELAQKTIRGGTWASIGPCHLLGSRCRRMPAESNLGDVGFRCARSVLRQLTNGTVPR